MVLKELLWNLDCHSHVTCSLTNIIISTENITLVFFFLLWGEEENIMNQLVMHERCCVLFIHTES
jgi:hypothetical protein